MMYWFLMILPWVGPQFHGGEMAEFHFSQEGEQFKVLFMIDQHELSHFDWKHECDLERTTALCLTNYINQHSTIQVNEKPITLQLSSSEVLRGQVYVQLESFEQLGSISTISVQLDCFYEFEPTYKNRVVFNFPTLQKSYLLTSEKKSVLIEL